MTNKNTHLNKPFLLQPAAKDYLWGGSRLNDDFSKQIDMFPLAETWECSTHPEGMSIVASGVHKGASLGEVLHKNPQYLGTHAKNKGELPLLIKFIDAQKDLSIQVHPNDEYAKLHENGQSGKTEVWYIMHAAKDAKLIYGLHHTTDKDVLRQSIQNGTIEKYLQKVPVKKDDIFFIEAGTIHAIGAGTLIVEIQQNSNLTYRLYDYNRVDKNGNMRELHIDKALEVANLNSSIEPRQPLRVLRYRQGCASELLCKCKYFQVHRMLINTERCRSLVRFQTDRLSFRVLLCMEGCGAISLEDEMIYFFKGDCLFVPADSVELRIHGKAQFLEVHI